MFQQEMLRGMQDAQELLKALGKELSAYAEYFSSFPEQAQKESAADRQDSGQAELMKELLKEMRDLTEIARKRQERGVFRKFKKMLKRKRR